MVLLLSGCNAKNETSEAPNPELEWLEEPDRRMTWNECFGLGGLFTEPAPTAPTGSEVPPGWEKTIDTTSSYQLVIFRCNRVSIGPYERPVTLMTEAHDRITVPQQCIDFNSNMNDIYVLVSLWLDDAEIADYLRTNYGMPVRVAKFSYSENGSLPLGQRRWTWSADGSGESEMGMLHLDADNGLYEWTTRMVWHNGTAVSMWDKKERAHIDNVPQLLAVYGVFHPPLLHARMNGEPVLGRGDTFVGDVQQTFHKFGDLECEEPL